MTGTKSRTPAQNGSRESRIKEMAAVLVTILLIVGLVKFYTSAVEGQYELSTARALQVDLNRDSLETIQLLPNLGEARARSIVLERETRGPFTDLADLQERIKGIGTKTAEGLAGHVTFGSPRSGAGHESDGVGSDRIRRVSPAGD